ADGCGRGGSRGGGSRGSGVDGGLEGFGFGEALLPGGSAAAVEVFGDFEVEGLADAVRRGVDQGTQHGLGVGGEAELALVVGAEVFAAEVEDSGAVDHAGVDDGFAAAEGEAVEVHEAASGLTA